MLYGVKSEVVDDFVSGASEEVAGELCTSQAHGQVAYGEHEHLGAVGCGFGGQAELLEVRGGTFGGQSFGEVSFGSASATTFAVIEAVTL